LWWSTIQSLRLLLPVIVIWGPLIFLTRGEWSWLGILFLVVLVVSVIGQFIANATWFSLRGRTAMSNCPMCRGGRLSHGKIGGQFIPDSWTFWSFHLGPYVAKRGFVCLDCGFMGQFLDEKALEKLRSDEAPKSKEPLDENLKRTL
jgi:hypothetical protein